MVDLLTITVVHTGGVSRPLYTSNYWEPSDSEGELEEEEEAEVEIVQHENVIDLTPLQAEELVPRAKLWVPTSKAKASARAAQGVSSSSSLPSSFSTFDPLRFFHPPLGCVTDPSKRPAAPGRAMQLPATAKVYFWHQQMRLVPLRDHFYKWGECPVIAFDYHQVIDTVTVPGVVLIKFRVRVRCLQGTLRRLQGCAT